MPALQPECTEVERWYGTKFTAGPLPDDWLQVGAAVPRPACLVLRALFSYYFLCGDFVGKDRWWAPGALLQKKAAGWLQARGSGRVLWSCPLEAMLQ